MYEANFFFLFNLFILSDILLSRGFSCIHHMNIKKTQSKVILCWHYLIIRKEEMFKLLNLR